LRQVNLLGQNHGPLLEGALQVNICELRTQVGRLPKEGNQSVFDFQDDIGARFNSLMQIARRLYLESCTTMVGELA
jgi:hypothetical protein